MPQTFGRRLQELRLRANLTQDQLSEATGISVWTLRGYEQDRREPDWRNAVLIARALGVTAESFIDCVPARPERPRPRPKGWTGPRAGRKAKES